MRVILLSDVPKVGRRFDVKEVADGFAANYLIPQRMAESATDKKVKALERQRTKDAERAAVQSELFHKDMQKLAGETVHISAKANEQGHLFKGLHKGDIISAIEKKLGIHLPEDAVQLQEPIKKTGEHTLAISADKEKVPVTVLVEGEK